MSTKIYNAYRVPTPRLNEAIAFFKEPLLSASLKQFYKLVGKEGNGDTRSYGDLISDTLEKCAARLLTADQSEYDVQSWIAIWISGDWAYLKPGSEFRLPEFGELPDWIQDYSYWNNTDKPKKVTIKAWDKRRDDWNEAMAQPRLYCDVLSVSGYMQRIDVRIQFRKWLQEQRIDPRDA